MPHTPIVVRCELPTPDMIVVNHPNHGTLLFADRRVPEDSVDALLSAIDSHVALHPADWFPDPRGWLSAAGA